MVKRRKRSSRLNRWWLRYEYKHTTLAVLAIILFVLLIDSALLAGLFTFLEAQGYLGGFIAGLLSVSFFTAVPAVVLIVDLALELDPIMLAFVAAVGSALGDWLVLHFYEEKVFHELKPVFKRTGLSRAFKALNRRSTRWILLLLGTFIISTPLPDELGLGLMGIAHYKRLLLVGICFILNFVGILTIIMAARWVAG